MLYLDDYWDSDLESMSILLYKLTIPKNFTEQRMCMGGPVTFLL